VFGASNIRKVTSWTLTTRITTKPIRLKNKNYYAMKTFTCMNLYSRSNLMQMVSVVRNLVIYEEWRLLGCYAVWLL
jgi:hypothetical protein